MFSIKAVKTSIWNAFTKTNVGQKEFLEEMHLCWLDSLDIRECNRIITSAIWWSRRWHSTDWESNRWYLKIGVLFNWWKPFRGGLLWFKNYLAQFFFNCFLDFFFVVKMNIAYRFTLKTAIFLGMLDENDIYQNDIIMVV